MSKNSNEPLNQSSKVQLNHGSDDQMNQSSSAHRGRGRERRGAPKKDAPLIKPVSEIATRQPGMTPEQRIEQEDKEARERGELRRISVEVLPREFKKLNMYLSMHDLKMRNWLRQVIAELPETGDTHDTDPTPK